MIKGFFAGDEQKALEKRLEVNPNDLDALKGLAQMYLTQNMVQETIEMFERVVKLNPAEFGYWRSIGKLCLRARDFERARYYYTKLLIRDPKYQPRVEADFEELGLKSNNQVPYFITLGQTLYESKMGERALHFFEKAILKDSKNFEAIKIMAQIFEEIGRLEDSASRYKVLLTTRPDDCDAYLSLANIHYKLGSYQDMRDTFLRVSKNFPDFVDEVLKRLEEHIKTDAKNLYLKRSYVDILMLVRRNRTALEVMEAFISDSEDPQDYLQLMELYVQVRDIKKAVKISQRFMDMPEADLFGAMRVLEMALEKNNGDLDILAEMAGLKARLGRTEEAMEDFRKVTSGGLKSATVFKGMAKISQEDGDSEKALEYYRKAYELEKDDPKVLRELAFAALSDNKLDEALELFVAILKQAPNNVEANREAAFLYTLNHDYEKAISCLRVVYKAMPKDISIRRDLAFALAEIGQNDEAIQHMQGILTVEEDNSEVKYRLAMLYKDTDQRRFAMQIFQELFEKTQDTFYLYELAKMHMASDRSPQAIKVYDEILAKDPSSIDKVMEIYMARLRNSNDDPHIQKALGTLLEFKGDYKNAIKAITLALKANSDDLELMRKLASLYTRVNELQPAGKAWMIILKNDQKDSEALANLAFIYCKTGNFNRAEAFAKNVQDREKLNQESKDRLDAVEKLLIERKMKEAKAQYDKDQSSEIAKLEYSKALYEAGRTDESIPLLQGLISSNSKLKLEALHYNGLCFLAKEFIDLAMKQFLAIGSELASTLQDRLNWLYQSARRLELEGMVNQAITVYKEILVSDLNYEDVSMRIEALSTGRPADGATMAGDMDVTMGDALPLSPAIRRRYRDIELLGAGGMGEVYRAVDAKLGRLVALKVMRAEFAKNSKALMRFIREAQASAMLNHPNIVAVYDVEHESDIFIAMEFVEGKSIRELIEEKGKMDFPTIKNYAVQMGQAIGYAHKKGIVHRDIKPDNLMVDSSGTIKVMDFGLARVETDDSLTKAGTVMGTPWYMSPEQVKGEVADGRSDIYSLGVTFYHMATGRVPFLKGQVTYHHVHTPPEPPSHFREDMPFSFENMILKCMEKDPNNRFQNCEDLVKEMEYIDF